MALKAMVLKEVAEYIYGYNILNNRSWDLKFWQVKGVYGCHLVYVLMAAWCNLCGSDHVKCVILTFSNLLLCVTILWSHLYCLFQTLVNSGHGY